MGKFWCYKHFTYDLLRLHIWSSLLCSTGGVLISFSETPKFHPDWVSVGSIAGNIHVNLIWLPFHVFYSVDILFSNNQQKTATGTMWYCQDSPNSTLNLILTQLPEQKNNEKERVSFRNSKNRSLCTLWIMCFKPSAYFQSEVKKPAFPVFFSNPTPGGFFWTAIGLFLLELDEIQIESANIKLVYAFP